MPAIEQLEQALDTFDGTVLLVSHDRSLLEHVRRTRTIRVESGRVVSDTPA
jgi:ATPase subunit of ABC transporter with duplicated ATPase domains